jgi:hypothetical protein
VVAGMTRRPIQDCHHPWKWLNIDVQGFAKPCCHATLALGNITEQSIEEIWNGDLLVRLRGAIRDGYIDPICRHAACTFVRDTEAAFGLEAYNFRCELDREYSISNIGSGSLFCSSGWSDPEYWGVWSDGKKATLDLDIPTNPSGDLGLKVLCRGAGNKNHTPSDIQVEVNGYQLDRWEFRHPESTEASVWKTTTIPAHISDRSRLEVCFLIERPMSPTLWCVEDARQLGIGISALVVSST